MSVLVVGSYVQDHAWLTDRFPAVGETRIGHYRTGPGGKGFNQAVAAHRYGVPTRFIGAVGRDAAAATAHRFAAELGLDAHFIAQELPTAASSIVVDAAGRNLIVVALGANLALEAAAVEACLASESLPRILLVQCEIDLEATAAALAWARRHGVRAVLNPAPVPAGLERRHWADAELLTPNETEFEALLRIVGILADVSTLSEADWRDDPMLHALARRLGVPRVVITLGAAGAFVSVDEAAREAGEAPYYRVAAPVVAVRDSTGAGDACSGALVAAWSEGRPFRQALTLAVHAAALSCETVGTAVATVDRATLLARFPALTD
ncbi:MAG: PfkB family carbohydrate kinase [Xanthomonadales bacterium]|jgi:ribokinase|nr:PfkB family carbohydrate kinase [Xanthomonadales bacterium]